MKFVLFDIDGTLIDSGGAGTESLNIAFEELFSVKDAFKRISMAGKTDIQIMREGLGTHGIVPGNGVIAEFCSAYVKHLRNVIRDRNGHVKKGIRAALDAITSDNGFSLGLLTGNIELGAQIKLASFGLDSYFELGAYGDDDEDRNNLLPIAIEKFHKRSPERISFSDCVVIGDTPRDIDCSKPYGAFSIAVATGPYPFETLAEAGPDVVLRDLSDTEELISLLKNSETRRSSL